MENETRKCCPEGSSIFYDSCTLKKNGKEFIGKASKAHKITLTTEDLTSKAFIYSVQKTKELKIISRAMNIQK